MEREALRARNYGLYPGSDRPGGEVGVRDTQKKRRKKKVEGGKGGLRAAAAGAGCSTGLGWAGLGWLPLTLTLFSLSPLFAMNHT